MIKVVHEQSLNQFFSPLPLLRYELELSIKENHLKTTYFTLNVEETFSIMYQQT